MSLKCYFQLLLPSNWVLDPSRHEHGFGVASNLRGSPGIAANCDISWNDHPQAGAPSWAAVNGERTEQSCDPFLNAEQTEMAIFQNTCACWIEPASIVADAQLHALGVEGERHVDLCWMGMLCGVGHGLLAYPQQVVLNERFRLEFCALNGKV